MVKNEHFLNVTFALRRFTTKPTLLLHLRVHAGESPYKDRPRKMVQCDVCSRVLSSNDALKDHMRMHTGEKPYVCKSCGKEFTFRSTLYRHVMRLHVDEKVQCDICSKVFSSKLAFKRHIKTHTKESYSCKMCNKSLAGWNSWKTHMQLHKNDLRTHHTSTSLKCNVCSKMFSSEVTLTDHLKIHRCNSDESKKVQCDVCSKALRKKSLKNHMRIHTGEKMQNL